MIVTRRLDPQSHRSLWVLSANARQEDVEAFIETAKKLTDPGDRNNVEAVLEVSVAANEELYNEISRRNSVMGDALRRLMHDVIEEEKRNAVQSAVQKAEQETLVKTIKSVMANLKLTADQAMAIMSIPTEKWEEYRAKL